MRKQYEAFPGTLNGMYMSGVMQQSTPAASPIAFAVPVSPSLFYAVSQALLSSLGLDIQAETSSREILDRYAENQTVPSGIPSSLTFQTWEAANGDISTFLQLRAAEFRAFWGVLSGLLGLSSSEADALYSTGQTVPVSPLTSSLGYEIYDNSGKLLIPAITSAALGDSGDIVVTSPGSLLCDYNSSFPVSFAFGAESWEFRHSSGTNYTLIRTFSNGTTRNTSFSLGSGNSYPNEVRLLYLSDNQLLSYYFVYGTGRTFANLSGDPNTTAKFISIDSVVGSTLVSSAPSGLSIDTPVNNWDTVNDDAGYYISFGTGLAQTADAIIDSVINTLSQTGTLTREGTYADSLSDAVGELDTPDRRS